MPVDEIVQAITWGYGSGLAFITLGLFIARASSGGR